MKTHRITLFKALRLIVLLLLLAGLGALIARFAYLNWKYPSPQVVTIEKNETLTLGNYQITVSGFTWGDGELLHEMSPGYVYLVQSDGSEYPSDQVRAGFVTLSVTKLTDDNTRLDATCLYFESGGWGNQFDMDLFFRLNPLEESLYVDLEKNETKEIILPMLMTKDQFRASTWNNIDTRDFYLVIQYYPTKYRFHLQPAAWN